MADDILAGESRTPEFLAMNPLGKVPLMALATMEARLSVGDYIAGGRFSIADIALFAYTHVAHEGGFDLSSYPTIRTWIQRIENRPGFVPMRASSNRH